MNKFFIFICLYSFSINSFCQVEKFREQNDSKTEKDTEFDGGSKISFGKLTVSQINDLDILGRVWGFLKYYHPVVATGKYDWDYELFRVIPKVLSSKSKLDRNTILSEWAANLGKAEDNPTKTEKYPKVKLVPDFQWINDSILGGKLTSQLITIKNAKRTDNHYYVGLIPNIGNPEFRHEKSYAEMKYPDMGFRILSLYRYWNAIQYYFPYKNLIGENWNDILKEFIPKYCNASNELEYKLTTLLLVSRIHDTHANIWKDVTLKNYAGLYYAPLELVFVENKAVVINYYDPALGQQTGLQFGDIIDKINNKSVDDIINERLPYTSASNYTTQLRVIAKDLLRTNDTLLKIEYTRGNSKTTANVSCFTNSKLDIFKENVKRDTCFKLVTPDISYLFIGSIKNSSLKTFIPEILKSKGLIIDLRAYPSDNIIFSLNEYLLPGNKIFAMASFASLISPGQFAITDSIGSGKKNTEFYKGKVVIIVNENTQSQGEFTAMAFKTAPKSVVVGNTTAGADGNVSYLILPGGIKTGFSGIGIYYPDGTETQRVGIVPDIKVQPTIKGIKEHRDELLEKAIEIINEE